VKEEEMDLFYQYECEIKKIDVGMLDLIGSAIESNQDDEANYIAAVKSDFVSPMLEQQYRVLTTLGDDICNSSIDTKGIAARMADLEVKQTAIITQLEAVINPAS
jgi:hypothetical protein